MASALHLVPKQPMDHAGAIGSTLVAVALPIAVVAGGGLAGAMLLVKHKMLGGILGGVAGLVGLGLWQKAHAAPNVKVTYTCPDGTPCPSGNLGDCPPPKMGVNDPDSPPGGWVYNSPVAAIQTVQQAAAALAAVDPCDPKNEQLVRNFQSAAGLAQLNASPGWDKVSPPGTDGRYGGDTAKALAQYTAHAPPACYSNTQPNRPLWWGAPGTYTNATA